MYSVDMNERDERVNEWLWVVQVYGSVYQQVGTNEMSVYNQIRMKACTSKWVIECMKGV